MSQEKETGAAPAAPTRQPEGVCADCQCADGENCPAAPAVTVSPAIPTPLSEQLKDIAKNWGTGDYVSVRPQMLNAAAQEIERLAAQALAGNIARQAQPTDRDSILEEAALACEAWGDAKVVKWQDDPEMHEDAKARAWDALQCAFAIRALKGKSGEGAATTEGGINAN